MRKILIVEDDNNIAELERDYLRLNGFAAEIEADGERAAGRALSGDYHLILVDLMLPRKNGFEIIEQIRQRLELPIIVVSARADDIDKIRGLGLGADDYLTKPFSPAELVARVKAHIDRYERLRGSHAPGETIACQGLEINTSSHRVLVNGSEVSLTAKEYDLLVFLASHPNMVFSKEHLYDSIWGQDYYGEIATVPVHIQRVRKKIEKDPANPTIIETLWGTGYRFNA